MEEPEGRRTGGPEGLRAGEAREEEGRRKGGARIEEGRVREVGKSGGEAYTEKGVGVGRSFKTYMMHKQ